MLYPHLPDFVTVPQRGVRKGGSDQRITQKSCVKSLLSHLKVFYLQDPPFRIPRWGTVSLGSQHRAAARNGTTASYRYA